MVGQTNEFQKTSAKSENKLQIKKSYKQREKNCFNITKKIINIQKSWSLSKKPAKMIILTLNYKMLFFEHYSNQTCWSIHYNHYFLVDCFRLLIIVDPFSISCDIVNSKYDSNNLHIKIMLSVAVTHIHTYMNNKQYLIVALGK